MLFIIFFTEIQIYYASILDEYERETRYGEILVQMKTHIRDEGTYQKKNYKQRKYLQSF